MTEMKYQTIFRSDKQYTLLKKFFFFLFFIVALSTQGQDIPARPNPPRLVNDFVGNLLSTAQIEALERKLVAYNDSTSTQITVVIVKSVQPYEMSDYAIKLGREWGVGQKDKNNGIVILWAPGDRKIEITTGYGMEGALPDAYAKRIIQQVIIPNFKQIRYYDGLDQGVDAIINYASGEYQAEESDGEDDILPFIFLIILLFILFIYIARKSKGGGGSNHSGGGGFPYTTYTGWGQSSGNWGGGGWSSGGGSDSGGGFGGFGGGSFGGGGAGGDY